MRRVGALLLLSLALALPAPASEPDGAALYARWCARCHGPSAEGGGRDAALFADPPPPLRGDPVLVRYTNEDLEAWIREGRRLSLGLRPELLEQQSKRTASLHRYLLRLPKLDHALVESGREIYAARCLPCHDDYGHPRSDRPAGAPVPPDLSRTDVTRADDDEIRARVAHGAPGMPALEPPVTGEEARALSAFVRQLSPGYETYDRFCAACHGPYGEGSDAPPGDLTRPRIAFDSVYFEKHGADWVLDRIWHMLRDAKARMPHFEASLSAKEVRAVLDYLRELEPRGTAHQPASRLRRVAFAPPASGKILFLRHCAECHGQKARGNGPTAVILSMPVPGLRDPELWQNVPTKDVAAWVLEGRKIRLELRPHALERHAHETEALYRFLRGLPATDWRVIAEGEALYLDRCLPCHDPHGHPQAERPEGVRAPRDLADPAFQAVTSDEELIRLLRHGKDGMPALVPRIGEDEARAILPYVRYLSPGYELYDRYCLGCHGPYGEGAVGLLKDFLAPEFAFDETYFRRRSEDEIRSSIWHMLRENKPSMPHFTRILDRAEIDRILDYVRTLP